MSGTFHHVTVLKEEAVSGLQVRKGGVYVDMTLGGGGHSAEILKRGGRLIGIDRDSNAIAAADTVLREISDNYTLVKSNFKDIGRVLDAENIQQVDGIIMDLGVSSPQLDEASRGFSYMQDAPLDMRMDTAEAFSAYDVVNTYEEERLCTVIRDYGEERWAKRIAAFICEARANAPLQTTGELVGVIKAAVPKAARRDGPHPAKRTFQAIRIEVNGELTSLQEALKNGMEHLAPGGRMSVITFHSLEDRIVKTVFAEAEKGCICPKEFPVCMCHRQPSVRVITRKPILPTAAELDENPRARSAKLRIAEKR